MKTQRLAPLAPLAALFCISIGAVACEKRQAGADDRLDRSAGRDQSSERGAGQASDPRQDSGGSGRANSDTTAPESQRALSPSGREFLLAAAENGTLEIQAGKLAAEKAASQHVKRFADMMVQAYSRVNDSLLLLAGANGVELSMAPSGEGQQLLEKLRGLSGAEFDKTYSEELRKAHRAAVQRFDTAARTASDPQIQAFAQEQLPAMRDHMRVAQSLPGPNQY